jgi:glucose/arabinose dehydrogenase
MRRCLIALLVALCGPALALQEGITPAGHRYATGGVSAAEQAQLRARPREFTLWVVTVARRSGAWLSDVQVTVSDARHQVVFDGSLDGPWLLLDLPDGRYDVQARLGSQWQTRATLVHAGQRQQEVFRFDVASDVLPPAERSAP